MKQNFIVFTFAIGQNVQLYHKSYCVRKIWCNAYTTIVSATSQMQHRTVSCAYAGCTIGEFSVIMACMLLLFMNDLSKQLLHTVNVIIITASTWTRSFPGDVFYYIHAYLKERQNYQLL